MKFIWNVSNTKSVKWTYSLVLSVMSVKKYYPNAEYVIYYDTNETKDILEKYLENIEYIQDDWSSDFCKKKNYFAVPFGSGVFNIFRATEEYSDFYFLDCDCFCLGEITFEKKSQISAMQRLNVMGGYSRCAIYVNGKVDFNTNDIKTSGLMYPKNWGDEILFKQLFGKITTAVKFDNLVHLGNEPTKFKSKNLNFSLFNQIYENLKENKDVLLSDYKKFIYN